MMSLLESYQHPSNHLAASHCLPSLSCVAIRFLGYGLKVVIKTMNLIFT